MPGRLEPLVTGEIYHVFNLGIEHRPTFTDKREYLRGLDTLRYYRFSEPPVKFSHFVVIDKDTRNQIAKKLETEGKRLVDCLCFCFMPNHFHMLLRQVADKGISQFMSKFQNSYTRYFNVRHDRIGSLFLDQFKAVRMQTEAQLMHVSRYIHLNPFSAYVVRELEDLKNYSWSSLVEYLSPQSKTICDLSSVLSLFKSVQGYREFIFDYAGYQRELEKIKHLVLEK